MCSKEELVDRIYDLIEEKGYPKEMIKRDFRVATNVRYDLCVIDAKSNEFLFVFDVRSVQSGGWTLSSRLKQSINRIIAQPTTGENTCIFYSINTQESCKQYVNDYLVRKEDKSIIEVDLKAVILSYDELKVNQEISRKDTFKKSINKLLSVVDDLKNMSILVTFFLVILLLLDIVGLIEITKNRLILIAIIVATLLIPFFGTIKIKDYLEIRQNNTPR